MKNYYFKKLILIIGLLLVVSLSLMLIGNKMRNDEIKKQKENTEYKEWLVENCECIVKDFYHCKEGFVFKGEMCYHNETKTYSNRLIGCSQYKCEEGIALLDNQTLIWGELK